MSIQLFRCRRENLSAISRPIPNYRAKERASQSIAPDRRMVSLPGDRRLGSMLCCLALMGCMTSIAQAQQVKVVIRVLPDSSGRATIEGSCAPTSTWSFRDSYAGILNLGSRVEG